MIDETSLLEKIEALKKRARRFLSNTVNHTDYSHGLVKGEWNILTMVEKEIQKLRESVVINDEKL